MDTAPFVRMLGSSKAIVMLLILSFSFLSLLLGKASWEQIENLVKWVFGSWVMAVGVEDAAKHVANGRVKAEEISSATYIKSVSLRPGALANSVTDVDGMNDTIPPPPMTPGDL